MTQQADPNSDTKQGDRTYRKGDSFLAMSGAAGSADLVRQRVAAMANLLPGLSVTAYRRSILERACRALLGHAAADEPAFRLRPHIIAEMSRLTDSELPRYLFYRYRYDVFPYTHELDDFPPCVQIEPTSICNYRCVFCYQTDRTFTQGRSGHMGMMTLDTFKRVVDEIAGEVEAVTLASRGEPLLARQVEDMLAYAAGKFLAMKVNTNAWYLDEAKIHALLSCEPNTVVFSADAADAELYSALRVNGKLDRVVDNIKLFRAIKDRHYPNSRTLTRVSGVRFSDRQDFDSIEAFWHDHVDQVAFVDYNPWENCYDKAPNDIVAPCSDLWRRAFVWWDGLFNPCDVDYRSTLAAGRVTDETPLSGLWRGSHYERLRAAHLEGQRGTLSPCKSCAVV